MRASLHYEIILHKMFKFQHFEHRCCNCVVNTESWSLWVESFIALEYYRLMDSMLEPR